MRNWLFTLKRLGQQLWVRASLFCIGSVVIAALAYFVGALIPQELAQTLSSGVLERLLSTITSSMLVIATFSLGTMVTAYTSVSDSASPRASPLLVSNDYAQNAISTFIGVFVFSVVAQVALGSEVYSPGGRAVLFATTLALLTLAVVTLIRWIDELSRLGQVGETLFTLEKQTRLTLGKRAQQPSFGGRAFEILPEGQDVCAREFGFVQSINFDAIAETVVENGWDFYLLAEPGTFVHQHRPLGRVVGVNAPLPKSIDATLSSAFTVGEARTTLQDPRFGLIIIGEAASRALSPGINDPGTAISAAISASRAIDAWHSATIEADYEITRGWLYANPLEIDELIDCAYSPIARYGAGQSEVVIRLLKVLNGIAALDARHVAPVCGFAESLLARAHRELTFAPDWNDVRLTCTRLASMRDCLPECPPESSQPEST